MKVELGLRASCTNAALFATSLAALLFAREQRVVFDRISFIALVLCGAVISACDTSERSDSSSTRELSDGSTPLAQLDLPVDPGGNPRAVLSLYADWESAQQANAGDENIQVLVRELSTATSGAPTGHAAVQIDLVNGVVRVVVEGMGQDPELELWFLAKTSDSSVRPSDDDERFVVGRLSRSPSEGSVFEATFDVARLNDFGIDTVVLSDRSGDETRTLAGRLPIFNRMHLALRMAERGWASRHFAPSPAALTSLVQEGFRLFTEETFDGNGRTCATCHRVENNYTIDPDFIATLPPHDPLFVHEYDATLSELESPQMLRQLGLVRANVDGHDKLPRLRSVPHIRGIAATLNVNSGPCARHPNPDPSCGFPPNAGPVDMRNRPILFGPLARARLREGLALAESVGWGGDGAPHNGSLEDFALGAIAQHFTRSMNREAGVDYRVPTAEESDALLLFQLSVGRSQDIDVSAIEMHDANAKVGDRLFNSQPGGCLDEDGVPHCACIPSISGALCGADQPNVPPGGGCRTCHANGGAQTDFRPIGNVRTFANANNDIGTVERRNVLAEEISEQYGEPLPVDCGLGRLSAEELEPWCTYQVSWFPYNINGPCDTGLETPAKDVYCAAPQSAPQDCTSACGAAGQPACNGWSRTFGPVTGGRPQPGKNAAEVFASPNGWHFAAGSSCDTPGFSVPVPVITSGFPNQAACEGVLRDAEWTPNGGPNGEPTCKCTTHDSCTSGIAAFCFREEGNPIDGWCLGLATEKTPFDPSNPDHVARAGNRVMVEPYEPVWSALPGFGSACQVPPPGVPSSCFGPLVCAGPFPGAPGSCSEDPNWTPEVLSFCEVTESYPNLEVPFGCFPGSPNPACQNCQAYCPPGVPGCVQCFLPGRIPEGEVNCPANNNPEAEALHAYGDGTFATPSVLESADTGPFFHDNSALTLEDAIRHYTSDEFSESPVSNRLFGAAGPVALDDTQIGQIAAYMRVLNAAENVSEAQRVLERAFVDATRGDARVTFADTEVEDAIQVLQESQIHADAASHFTAARDALWHAFRANKAGARKWIARAIVRLDDGRRLMLTVSVDPSKPNSGYTAEYLTPSVPSAIREAAAQDDEL